ncbi:MAG: hypothetical protein VYE68_11280 [Acidobacteriota bacterium]|nr:hypothetical protein [Acidobacteriota bacterium]
MKRYTSGQLVAAALATLFGVNGASGQVPPTLRQFGAPVAPMFEGWYRNPNGTATVLVGFFNPNQEQTVSLPVGEWNRFSPGAEDRGQPTHFPPGRSWGVLTVQVPGDFSGELSWTLTANEQPASIPVHLRAPYFIEPFRDAANGNEPPTIRFSPDDEPFTGPPVGIAHHVTATVGTPLELGVWTSDVKPVEDHEGFANPFVRATTLRWHLHRGPATVQLAEAVQTFEDSEDENPTTTVTFPTPGEYWLRVEALDETGVGGGGFQCCWTSAIVQVMVD